MNKIRKLITLTSVMALCASQVQGQDENYLNNAQVRADEVETPMSTETGESQAYIDSGNASYLSSLLLPIGAIGIAAVIIATTNNNRHHHSGNSSGTNTRTTSTSNSHHFHSSSTGNCF